MVVWLYAGGGGSATGGQVVPPPPSSTASPVKVSGQAVILSYQVGQATIEGREVIGSEFSQVISSQNPPPPPGGK